MSIMPEQLFAYLDQLGIEHRTVEHPPFFTVEEGRIWHDKIPGLHCKNLFLKDEKGALWLVTMPAEKRADLKQLRAALQAPKFSFGKPELLLEILGVPAGSVTPFALLNDKAKRVNFVLDHEVTAAEWMNVHPLHNAASTVIRSADLLKFVRSLHYEPRIVDCGAAAA